ncbi:hypothetical protein [Polaromonas sp. DSR2-3-2]|uniref:hypothetical protein n=1 Tax=unclassified Polaromonas TaxID=2638319 RepID=UPI003CFACA24
MIALEKYEKNRLLGPAHRAGRHDEPSLSAFNGGRLGDLGKSPRAVAGPHGGCKGDWNQAFTHFRIVTMPAFGLADRRRRQGLDGTPG